MSFALSELSVKNVLFPAYMQPGASGSYFLSWPTDRYYGLVEGRILLQYLQLEQIFQSEKVVDDFSPESERIEWQIQRLLDSSLRRRYGWPALPLLERRESEYQFIDGRHRCLALAWVGVDRIPVLVVTPQLQSIS